MRTSTNNAPLWIRRLVIMVAIVGVCAFIGLRLINVVQGPQITVTFPPDYYHSDTGYITVTGSVQNSTELTINDYPVIPQADNTFAYALLAPPGYSIIELETRDRFGSTDTVTHSLWVSEEPDDIPDSLPTPPPEESSSEPSPDTSPITQ